jgi:hypothetical protein
VSWTNAFDLGACMVEVYQVSTGTASYSGTLGKGQGADLTLSTWNMHIAVSSAGVVTLTNTSGTGLEVDVGVRVLPSYVLSSMAGARATLPTSASGSGDASANGTTLAGFTNGDGSVDLSAQDPYNRIEAQTNTIGSSSASVVVQFTPEFLGTPVAPNETLTVDASSTNNAIAPAVTQGGVAVTPDSLTIVSDPSHGTASVSGASLLYTPNANFVGSDSFTYQANVGGVGSNVATVSVTVKVPCDDPVIEVWQKPSSGYQLRVRAYAEPKPFSADTDTTSVDARLVFLLALANAKAHYQQPDWQQYMNQFQMRLRKLRAREHNNMRYTAGSQWAPPPQPKIKGLDVP